MGKLKKHYENKNRVEDAHRTGFRKRSISAYALESSLVDFKGIKNKLSANSANSNGDSLAEENNFSSSHINRKHTEDAILPAMMKSISNYDNDDIEQLYENLLSLININSEELPCPQTPLYPKFLIEFLNKKFVSADEMIQNGRRFDMNK